jgi:predicted ATPase
MYRGELRTGLALAEEALGLAECLGNSLLLSQARYTMGQFHLFLGDFAVARAHLEAGLALYDPERDRAKAARYGFDICMACHSYLGLVLWDLGFPDQALRHAGEAIGAARAAAHPLSEAWALTMAAMAHQLRGEATLCLERAESALALATEQVLPVWSPRAMVFGGWVLVKKGHVEEGLARLHAGLGAYPAMGSKVDGPQWLALLAEAYLATGQIEEGLSAVREGLAAAEETAARYYEAELNRLEGELQLASKEPDDKRAEASFRNAIAIARGQGAKSFELSAATSLARLLARQARCEEASALLAPVYGWFTEGFDTKDLKDAKALLGELA